jgi:hypothetical protein
MLIIWIEANNCVWTHSSTLDVDHLNRRGYQVWTHLFCFKYWQFESKRIYEPTCFASDGDDLKNREPFGLDAQSIRSK